MTDLRQQISEALTAFARRPLADAAIALFETLGYRSEKRFAIQPNTPAGFAAAFDSAGQFRPEKALAARWVSIDFMFQLTDDEIRRSANQNELPFESTKQVDNKQYSSYLFFAIELAPGRYTLTNLADMSREVNRLFRMPVMLLFKQADTLTLAIINRRLNRKDADRDVLEKVTLIKDISVADPHRAHIEILRDLALPVLYDEYFFHNFVGLHNAWEKRLATYQLNNRFYRDLADWYFWALQHKDVVLPRSIGTDAKDRSIFFMRLITRLMFCWFLQEKNLIPRDLFRPRRLQGLLQDFGPKAGTFYKAVLQNLFFATLNQAMGKRQFRKKNADGFDDNRGSSNFYRHADLFAAPDEFRALVENIPFLNGGLFECLDIVFTKAEGKRDVRLDDFSEETANRLHIPNELFFGDERELDLSEVYQDKRYRKEKVRGLVEIFSRYKFTIEENTPLEEEIALDPELLGKVFENLLASFNEDTETSARKAIGAFYTPREVVSFMVDEALLAHLGPVLKPTENEDADVLPRLRQLLTGEEVTFSDRETADLIAAIDSVKILDPACGSGAFLMGALRRLVDLLQKLDPNNRRFKQLKLDQAKDDLKRARCMENSEIRETTVAEIEERIADIERSFNTHFHELDFARKLYLIENCIYGIDIQPIACQIAKLRFFISLICDQRVDPKVDNLGVRPLPNLETKVVAANTLVPIEHAEQHQFDLLDQQVRPLRDELEEVRHEYFNARNAQRKAKCRAKDEKLRQDIADLLRQNGMPATAARQLAQWNPYDQQHAAAFFDSAWMFGLPIGRPPTPGTRVPRHRLRHMRVAEGRAAYGVETAMEFGFDIVVSNPPYVRQEQIKDLKPLLKPHYDCYTGASDLYVYFYERSLRLLRAGGILSFISSNKFFRSGYGEPLRDYLTKKTHLLQVIDFGDAPVFTAIAYPTIVLARKLPPTVTAQDRDGAQTHVLNWDFSQPIEKFADIVRAKSFTMSQPSLSAKGWKLEGKANLALLETIRKAGQPLDQYVSGRFYYGIKTGLNEAFVIDRATRDALIDEHKSSGEIIKPFLRGRDVKRWSVEPQDLWLIFTRRGIDITKYPAILDHLKPFKKQLLPGAPGGRKPGSYEWYEIQDNIAYWQEFEQPKIVVPAITDTVNYALDAKGFYSNDKTSIFIPPSLPYSLAVVNSQVSGWFTRQTFATKQGGFYEFKPMYVSQIPIPAATEEHQGLITVVVNYLLWIKELPPPQLVKAELQDQLPLMIGYFEQVINGMVYELFFPDELHARKLFPFQRAAEAQLPVLTEIKKGERPAMLKQTFDRIYDTNNALRGTLFSISSIEPVRIIEGRT